MDKHEKCMRRNCHHIRLLHEKDVGQCYVCDCPAFSKDVVDQPQEELKYGGDKAREEPEL